MQLLQGFLRHAHGAGTLPDVLTWHVSEPAIDANATKLEDDHATLRQWAAAEGIPLPPIGHNEIIGPAATLSPARNLAALAAAERLGLEHSCRACWTDAASGISPCADNSLDALLTDDCAAHAPFTPACLGLCGRPRSVGTIEAPSMPAGGSAPAISSMVGIRSQKAHGCADEEPGATTPGQATTTGERTPPS